MPQTIAPLDDAALVRRHLSGDEQAFAELYLRYHGRVLAFVRMRLRDASAAEDVAQDVLLRAHDRLHHFDVDRPLWPWLRTIASNLCVDHVRRQARQARLVDQLADSPSAPGASLAEGVAERALLQQALSEVPPRQRDALLLCYQQGFRPVDAAPRFGLGRNAFEQLLHRARRNLRKAYQQIEVTTREGAAAVAMAATRVASLGRGLVAKVEPESIAALALSAAVTVGVAAPLEPPARALAPPAARPAAVGAVEPADDAAPSWRVERLEAMPSPLGDVTPVPGGESDASGAGLSPPARPAPPPPAAAVPAPDVSAPVADSVQAGTADGLSDGPDSPATLDEGVPGVVGGCSGVVRGTVCESLADF